MIAVNLGGCFYSFSILICWQVQLVNTDHNSSFWKCLKFTLNLVDFCVDHILVLVYEIVIAPVSKFWHCCLVNFILEKDDVLYFIEFF